MIENHCKNFDKLITKDQEEFRVLLFGRKLFANEGFQLSIFEEILRTTGSKKTITTVWWNLNLWETPFVLNLVCKIKIVTLHHELPI
jgi:thiamine pyrophosphokinase